MNLFAWLDAAPLFALLAVSLTVWAALTLALYTLGRR